MVGGMLPLAASIAPTGRTPMCYVGLDISLSSASVCVVDQEGAVLCEAILLAEVADIARFLHSLPTLAFGRSISRPHTAAVSVW